MHTDEPAQLVDDGCDQGRRAAEVPPGNCDTMFAGGERNRRNGVRGEPGVVFGGEN